MPKPPAPPVKRTSFLGIFLAVVAALLGSAVLFFLTLGAFGVIVLVAGGLFAMVALQYLLWGRWLGPMIRSEVDAEEPSSASDDD